MNCFNNEVYANSMFRQPEFISATGLPHYHKTLSPPKTTVAGMIGSALGISLKKLMTNG